ncbi:homeodomain-like, Myb-like domain, C2H2- zinc finger protein family [Artemisia annua]|uniref:Homeodomain-like, Myb-like domain, C2H2-zinc finger protein family n=1 Tax=Artemisia annua TaxID=35608 RepID=A0A2U1P8Z0_ARTAN|nr:homeodomain-like, Myb-like domain, C2H2- zinc finger protein family [Artemisia annua]
MIMMNIPQEQLVIISGGVGEEGDFVVSKRNKGLWEVVGVKMEELGHVRSGAQCKWKNLDTRYKGKETSDRDNTRSFPFFDKLHTLFTRIPANTPPIPFDPEATSSQSNSRKRVTRTGSYQSLEEISEDEDEKNITKHPMPPRKKPEREKHLQTS